MSGRELVIQSRLGSPTVFYNIAGIVRFPIGSTTYHVIQSRRVWIFPTLAYVECPLILRASDNSFVELKTSGAYDIIEITPTGFHAWFPTQ